MTINKETWYIIMCSDIEVKVAEPWTNNGSTQVQILIQPHLVVWL